MYELGGGASECKNTLTFFIFGLCGQLVDLSNGYKVVSSVSNKYQNIKLNLFSTLNANATKFNVVMAFGSRITSIMIEHEWS